MDLFLDARIMLFIAMVTRTLLLLLLFRCRSLQPRSEAPSERGGHAVVAAGWDIIEERGRGDERRE
jgi:hypothetical protein